ncbi:MAG: ribosome-associated translation inhibitor RaiA [Betaproteobacteria bacterium]|nr:ribosome-associated translation inhibitor RaiA [Betaproteobacteria bacterium]MDE2621780.1 ribosome-associated translation inhibitor RaiA [Betaproteobacteria bacterium]
MNVTVTGQQVEITPAIRNYVVEKMERVKRHFEPKIDVNVVVKVEKLMQHVEANLRVPGHDLFAKASNTDLYAAIDELVHTLDRQVIRIKEKQNDQRNGNPIKHLSTD